MTGRKARVALAWAALLLAGCSWEWDSFQRSDAGTEDASADGGGTDGAVTCAGALIERCGASQLCARPASVEGCCAAGACLDPGERPIAWARAMTGETWVVDGIPDEVHWTTGPESFPLTHVSAASLPDPADADASFRVAWESRYLRFWVHLEDDAYYRPGTGTLGYDEVDAIEIFLDADPTRDDPLHENRMVFEIQDTRAFLEHRDQTWSSAIGAGQRDGSAWDIEIELEISDTGTALSSGDAIGLDVIFRDFEDGATPLERWQWGICGGPNRQTAGLIVLGEDAPPSTLPRCPETCDGNVCAPEGYACDRASATLCP